MEEMEERKQKKAIRHSESWQWIEECVENITKQETEVTSKKDVWHKILRTVVSPEHNGTNKDPNITWHQFFEEAIGCQVLDIPETFKVADLPFEQAIVLISTQIGALGKEQAAVQKRLQTATTRKLGMEKREAKKKTTEKHKADKFIELKEGGGLEADLETKRLAHVAKFSTSGR